MNNKFKKWILWKKTAIKNAKTHHDFHSVFAPSEPIAVIRKHTIAHVFRRLSCVLQKHIFIKHCLWCRFLHKFNIFRCRFLQNIHYLWKWSAEPRAQCRAWGFFFMSRTSDLAFALLLRISVNWTIRISYLFMPLEIMSDVRSVIQRKWRFCCLHDTPLNKANNGGDRPTSWQQFRCEILRVNIALLYIRKFFLKIFA